ncbi:polyketide cyclase/dehydrase/lipid transport protein [Prauserella shujinwangii]|uniref:Polyketide cyclase/dehydrase/lipid transport protein n=1 Tax=Prauserella shujinwangii TaxID=1453103 RepID=A0A2T0LNA4_9PSEU|nr:SRPBCC family protein [Prauserella shujinwangii]PRX44639.1 polyketide cyclase/dehydrase/lipid transport protein [Prauserella shujinwangii]
MAGKRYSFEVRRTSTAPPERLFRLETDGAGWSDWAKPVIVVSGWERLGTPEPGGVGAIRKVGAWPLLMREETVEYEPGRRHVYTFAGAPEPVGDYRAEVLFTPTDSGGTELCWRGSFTAKIPGSGPLARVLLEGAIRYLSARLVRAAERT